MAAKINPVPTYPDISPTSYGNKSIILTIINATSAWKLEDKAPPD